MRSEDEQSVDLEGTYYRELRFLEEVHINPDQSQRQLARRLGIALGVANVLVRRMVIRGYIRVSKLGWKSWAYILTPAGLSRKIHLTFAYVERFVEHYRSVRMLLREEINALSLDPESRVALVGTSDLAELAYLALRDIGVEHIEIFGDGDQKPRFLGMQVNGLDDLESGRFSDIVVADHKGSSDFLDRLYVSGIVSSQVVRLLHPIREGGEH